MKHHLIQYLREYRDQTFREHPFSEVDALLLAQLSYLKLDGIVPGFGKHQAVGWRDIMAHPDFERVFEDEIYGPAYRKIFELICSSRRYGAIRLNYFVNEFDREREQQFAAVTLFLGEKSIYISYRGTDESLVGWKEDFNMSFMNSIPAQRLAVRYLLRTAACTSGRIVLGGHSKGGNLAVFASTYAPGHLRKRIRRVYSFDGPGFRREFYRRGGYRAVETKVCKIVPEDSVIGLLFSNDTRYRVVRSYRRGVLQHDLLCWKIREGRFVYRDKIYSRRGRRMRRLNEWIESFTPEQLTEIVEVLYQMFRTAQIDTVYDLVKKPFYQIRVFIRIFRRLDGGRRRLVAEAFRRLLLRKNVSV